MGLQDVNAIISIVAVLYLWLVVKPQQTENKSIHESMDKISVAIDKLSDELQASRVDRAALKEQTKTLFNNHDEFKQEIRREIEGIKKEMGEIKESLSLKCERGNPNCLKK